MRERILSNPNYFEKNGINRKDYDEIDLTFVCSSKGGIGKTTFAENMIISKIVRDPNECAICHKKFKHLNWKHLKTHGMDFESYKTFIKMVSKIQFPVIIDANENNQDIVVIFDGFQNASRTIETETFVMRELIPYEGADATFILVYPKKHIHHAVEMYEFIQLIIDSIPTRKTFIVDSAFHIERFTDMSEKNGTIDNPLKVIYLHKDIVPKFWFLWRWSAPANYIEIHKIQRAISWFRLAFENWTDDNFISVFNLYDLYHQTTDRNLNKIVSTWDKTLRREYIVSSVNFDDLIDLINKLRHDMRGYKVGKTIEIKKIPSLWIRLFHQLLRVLKVKHIDKPVIPSNIVIIPTFYRGLVMTIDGLTLDRPADILEIAENMKPFTKRLQMFFRIRQEAESHKKKHENKLYKETWKTSRLTRESQEMIILPPSSIAKSLKKLIIQAGIDNIVEIVSNFQELSIAIKFKRYKFIFIRGHEEDEEDIIIDIYKILKELDDLEFPEITVISSWVDESLEFIKNLIKKTDPIEILIEIQRTLGLLTEEDEDELSLESV